MSSLHQGWPPDEAVVPQDALTLLKREYRYIEQMFSAFNCLAVEDWIKGKQLADHIGAELLRHMTIEEELFYPAVLGAVPGTDASIREGIRDHFVARDLIRQIKAMRGTEKLFRTRVKVLQEHIERHVEEEEYDLFPYVEGGGLNLVALGELMADRKEAP